MYFFYYAVLLPFYPVTFGLPFTLFFRVCQNLHYFALICVSTTFEVTRGIATGETRHINVRGKEEEMDFGNHKNGRWMQKWLPNSWLNE